MPVLSFRVQKAQTRHKAWIQFPDRRSIDQEVELWLLDIGLTSFEIDHETIINQSAISSFGMLSWIHGPVEIVVY